MTGPATREEVLEQVRVNLLRYLERHQAMSLKLVAQRIGYSYEATQKFANGTVVTGPVALKLIQSFPEIGDGVICPFCGHAVIV